MSEWTCKQVEGWIDLDAAGETDAPTRAALGRHRKVCPACAEAHRQARQLLGLLDQRLQESERLQRLWARLEAVPKRARRPARLGLWRAAALAASILVALGLSSWLGPGEPNVPAGPQLAAVLNSPAAPEAAPPGPAGTMVVRNQFTAKAMDAARPAATEPEYPATPVTVGAALPPPPTVDLILEVHNPGRDVLPLRFGDEGTELILDLQGPGARDEPAPAAAAPLAALGLVRIAPGGTYTVPIHKLACGFRGAVRYLYWTEPGEYTLTITLRARVETAPLAGAREVVATSGPIKVRVGKER